MNVLIIGSGGRECTFAWKLAQSKKTKNLFIAPGNAGTSKYGTNLDIDTNNFEKIKEAVLAKKINMVLVGPEDPLVNGLHDFSFRMPSLNIFRLSVRKSGEHNWKAVRNLPRNL